MTPGVSQDPPRQPAASDGPRRVGARVALAAFFALATAFIVLSSVEIIGQAFGLMRPPAPLTGPNADDCIARMTMLLDALDVASAEARREDDSEEAARHFASTVEPAWEQAGDLRALCGGSPQGSDAVAALYRLREAHEARAREDGRTLGPLRRRVAAYLNR